MIIDSLNNLVNYTAIHPLFERVAHHLKQIDLNTLPEGRYEIDGDNLFFSLVDTPLRSAATAPLESHDQYIDIQIILRGTESFGWHDRQSLTTETAPYSTGNDITFYGDIPSNLFTLQVGQCIIFFPNDAHAPLIGEGSVRKCIVKVKCKA